MKSGLIFLLLLGFSCIFPRVSASSGADRCRVEMNECFQDMLATGGDDWDGYDACIHNVLEHYGASECLPMAMNLNGVETALSCRTNCYRNFLQSSIESERNSCLEACIKETPTKLSEEFLAVKESTAPQPSSNYNVLAIMTIVACIGLVVSLMAHRRQSLYENDFYYTQLTV
eukprot:CAMPEP_0114991700 /NCGR_PEP_ID=MMETSP0216-20121206/11520_1 /TAXON_ID=223996 /ORGANISM="Protocruzia adherens, Strain Boccale" /LENGTH=172 /DNA_ID=CAMNT_0002355061 /DNA_START=38 /DNA_END=556 /DNA_ORIENTATION=+